MSVPSWLGIQLLRIVQEALSNTRRHAQATQIALRLKETDGMLKVQIEDNGQGFDPGRTPDDRLGLSIMRERAESVGGSLELDSQPGQGTRVVIRAPL
jgi:signal transduction histidine kinase